MIFVRFNIDIKAVSREGQMTHAFYYLTFNVYTVWWNEFVLFWKTHVASKDMLDTSACCDNTIDYIVCLIGVVGSTSKCNFA